MPLSVTNHLADPWVAMLVLAGARDEHMCTYICVHVCGVLYQGSDVGVCCGISLFS